LITRDSAHLLQRIAVEANEATTVEQAVQVCLDEVCRFTQWPIGHAYLLAEDGTGDLVSGKLWCNADAKKFQAFREVTEETRFQRDVGLPGRVLTSGKPAWIKDVTKDANFPRAALVSDIGVRAGFAFPVLIQDETVAVLEFFSDNAVDPDPSVLEVMAHVGTQLGRVVERERANRELAEQMAYVRLLERVAVAANVAARTEDAFLVCLEEVCAVTGWPIGHAYLLAEDGTGDLVSGKLWCNADAKKFQAFRKVTEETRFQHDVGLPGRVLTSGKPTWIKDVTKDPNFPRAELVSDIGVRAGFAFPVLVGETVVAVLEYFSDKASEPDVPLLEVMAQVGIQLGRVVERKRNEDALRQANEELEQRVEERTHHLKREVAAREIAESTALSMQVALLPDAQVIAEIQEQHHLEVASYFRPSSTLSGDIWGLKSLNQNRLGVYLVDFSGHGVHAALNTFRMHTLLNQAGMDLGNPSRCMSTLNHELSNLLTNGQFGTMLCGVIDTERDAFIYSAAASTHPLIFIPGREELSVGDSSGLPLGIKEDAVYERREIDFPPGAMLFLYSDALTETLNRAGNRMSTEELKARVTECLATGAPADVLDKIVGGFLDSTDRPIPDDLTLITICRHT